MSPGFIFDQENSTLWCRRYICPPNVSRHDVVPFVAEVKRKFPLVLVVVVHMQEFDNGLDYVKHFSDNYSDLQVFAATKLKYSKDERIDGLFVRERKTVRDATIGQIYAQQLEYELDEQNPFSSENLKKLELMSNKKGFGFLYGENNAVGDVLNDADFADIWWMKEIHTRFDDMKPEDADDILGINVPMVYWGAAGTGSSDHLEECKLCSMNFLFFGSADKLWLIKHAESFAKLNRLLLQYDYTCPCPIQHKNHVISKDLSDAANCQSELVVQRAGDWLFTFAETVHEVLNTGNNFAIAKNWMYDGWHPIARKIPRCTCEVHPDWQWCFDLLHKGEFEMKPVMTLKKLPTNTVVKVNNSIPINDPKSLSTPTLESSQLNDSSSSSDTDNMEPIEKSNNKEDGRDSDKDKDDDEDDRKSGTADKDDDEDRDSDAADKEDDEDRDSDAADKEDDEDNRKSDAEQILSRSIPRPSQNTQIESDCTTQQPSKRPIRRRQSPVVVRFDGSIPSVVTPEGSSSLHISETALYQQLKNEKEITKRNNLKRRYRAGYRKTSRNPNPKKQNPILKQLCTNASLARTRLAKNLENLSVLGDNHKIEVCQKSIDRTRKLIHKYDEEHLLLKVCFTIWDKDAVENRVKQEKYTAEQIISQFVSTKRQCERARFWDEVNYELESLNESEKVSKELLVAVEGWKTFFDLNDYTRIPCDDPAKMAIKKQKPNGDYDEDDDDFQD